MTGYLGSKGASGLYQNIIAMMPPHDTYIETHLGSGEIMQRKPPSLNSIGIEIDPQTLSDFECSHTVKLVNGCAHQFLTDYQYTGKELIYIDPPYLKDTRTSNNSYRFDYTDKQHIELLQLITALPCSVILSGYPSSLYDDYLYNWNTVELQAMTRGGVRTEKIWFNYDIDQKFWVKFAGKNFTDRQRIKRKAERWAKNYEAMPKLERLAMLAAIMSVEKIAA